MVDHANSPVAHQAFILRHQVAAYFLLTFALSWTGALAVVAPHLVRRETLPQMTGILMFPAMLLGPSLAGVVLTGIADGRPGLRILLWHLLRVKFPAYYYDVLLLPPLLILAMLICLKTFVSSVYAPNLFPLGIAFGVPAGILEEIGWMGYAFPRMWSSNNALGASVLLGLLWSLWHLPVANFLGVAVPHGDYWLPFFLVFAMAMTAMRVLIGWLYVNTQSLLLAQLMHISSTGSLVVFGATHVTARQEVLWYGLYGLALWLVVGLVVKFTGGSLARPARSKA